MDNAIRWIFCLVTTALLLYACVMYHNNRESLGKAEKELAVLRDTEQALREENRMISEQLAASVEIGSD